MVALVDHALVLVIVVTVVSRTINHMRYSYVLERFTILRNHVTS